MIYDNEKKIWPGVTVWSLGGRAQNNTKLQKIRVLTDKATVLVSVPRSQRRSQTVLVPVYLHQTCLPSHSGL